MAAPKTTQDPTFDALLQDCRVVLNAYRGMARMEPLLDAGARLEGRKRDLEQSIATLEGHEREARANLDAFKQVVADETQALQAQLAAERKQVDGEIHALHAKLELTKANMRDAMARLDEDVKAKQQDTDAEKQRIDNSLAAMRKTEREWRDRMQRLRGNLEDLGIGSTGEAAG